MPSVIPRAQFSTSEKQRVTERKTTIMRYIILTALIILFIPPLEAQERIVFSRAQVAPTLYRLMGMRVLKEAYAKCDVALEFKDLPAERALVSANNGVTDGEFIRVADLEREYPNLIMIPVPVAYEDIVIYTKNVEFAVEGWHSLSPYRIGFIRGFKLAEINTKGMNVESVGTIKRAFLKLDAGRNDVVVDLRSAQCVLKDLNLSTIKALEPPLMRMVQYHYLHKRHKALAYKLEAIMTYMKQEGELKAIQERAIKDFADLCQKNR